MVPSRRRYPSFRCIYFCCTTYVLYQKKTLLTIVQNRIPECWFPGSFDVLGQSHTLWHILVFLAMGAHVFGLLQALDYNYNHGICG
jgi:predicted membrane channel-forming protein YqfA (hemolysin III family)